VFGRIKKSLAYEKKLLDKKTFFKVLDELDEWALFLAVLGCFAYTVMDAITNENILWTQNNIKKK